MAKLGTDTIGLAGSARTSLRFRIGGVPLPKDHEGIFTQDDVKPSGYDLIAKESNQKYKELRHQGIIPPGVRFQVSLPSPHACIQSQIRPEFQEQLEPFYGK
ncbi:hypothetical protein N7509_006098 [Penicillium cosmopolitanum]|uniref:Uncharacterized protein n=1 Tax=Penicillium cosmopolitanum TaxID=1131564 RepID=A0A9W9W3J5_9EURO|nr:uncharacterized protein N7509_006098 [Penicillium cosmopolitanum]KAJ5397985.1 hypothetical protein N7509_006098 [Penicillium cosmopolitanum]